MMRPHLSWCLAFALMGAGGAEASCARFTATPVSVTYNPLGAQASSQISQPISLFANNSGTKSASVVAQFVDQQANAMLRIGTGGPTYTITRSSNSVVVPLGSIFNPSYAFGYTFENPNGGSESVGGVMLYIDPGQDVAAGVYRENLDIQYQCSGTGTTDTQSGVLPIVVDVPSTLTASLAGGSSRGTLDFGDFSTLTQTAMVNVSSTGPYAVRINSANGQVMKLTTPPPGAAGAANAQIPYTVTFDGAPVSATDTRFSRSGVGGTNLPLSITAGPVAGKRAGVYHDVITVTFTPLATL